MSAGFDASKEKSAAIRSDIEQTRGEMSKTINQIEERLSPAHLKEQIADIKESALGTYHDAKDHVKEDITREIHDAKIKVQEEVHQVKAALREELHQARMAVREATVGKVEHMVQDARDTVNEAGTTILDTIKENPIPAAMLAIGLGWLFMSGSKKRGSLDRDLNRARGVRVTSGSSYGANMGGGYHPNDRAFYGYDQRGVPMHSNAYGHVDQSGGGRSEGVVQRAQHAVGDVYHSAEEGISSLGHRVKDGAEHLVEGAQGAMHDVTDKVSSLAHRAGEGVEHLAHDAQQTGLRAMHGAQLQARRVEQGFETVMRDNPLAVGAVAMAIGAAVGLALPHTAKEDEWMGEAKERLFDRAEGVAHDAIKKVEEKVEELTSDQGRTSNGHNGHGDRLSQQPHTSS